MKFRHTLFFRLLTLFVSLFSVGLILTLLVFLPIGRNLVTDIKSREMEPVLRSMNRLVQDYILGVIDENAMNRVIVSQSDANRSQLIIVNTEGIVIYATRPIRSETSHDQPGMIDEIDYTNRISAITAELLSNRSVNQMFTATGHDFESLVVGEPIIINQKLVGAVAMILPAYEITSTLNGLIRVLILTMLAVIFLMAIPIYFFSKIFTRPINKMVHVAQGMGMGNFDLRADVKDQGELGQLGRSLNQLSSDLSQTINDVAIERDRLMKLVESMGDGILSFDATGKVQTVNPAFYQVVGSDEGNRHALSILDDPKIQDAIRRSLDQENMDFLYTHLDRILRITLRPILDENKVLVGSVGLFRDVTESERLDQLRKDYVANVSHELRTPLTAIKGLIDPLHDGLIRDDEKRKEYYALILKETARLTRLINDLLELSRLQSTNQGFERRDFDLNPFLTDIKEKYRSLAQEKGIDLQLTIPESPSPYLGNEDRMDQVLTVLLDNAFKFTPMNGNVEIKLDSQPTHYTLIVQDTGTGIDPVDLPYIFDRFYTVDKARSAKSTGLGLSIAKEILTHLGESIRVESTLEQGTSFIIKLNKPSP
ncbi:MAG: HAMP domain-containing protein [Erysipelotrichaceae bacterium]|nr:HAMP domain-containing protein [Erysipelotrichaceae bacterium]